VLRLTAPDGKHRWVSKRFAHIVERTASSVLTTELRVEFFPPPGSSRPVGSLEPHTSFAVPQPALNPRYSFDQFVIGESNQLAHAAALAVAEAPGQAYNPLFLYAPPGLGKTHLLHAIGNYLNAFSPGAAVRYTTAETFTNHFLNALATRSIERFKHAYRNADVLLIDDVQFLASKARTEEEFFHTFNALYERGRQLVVTCDRLPEQLTAVEERLRERFEAGLVAEIAPPDFRTRRTILQKRAEVDGIALADRQVLDLVAARITTNVRALEGALIRIVAFNSLTMRPIDCQLATAVLEVIHPRPASDRKPSIAEIQAAVATHFGVTVKDLVSPTRSLRLVVPRQLAMFLTRELTEHSLHEIGAAFGGRNHTTVVHSCAQVTKRLADHQPLEQDLVAVRTAIAAWKDDRAD
jgi:chromosomal replication initiator protein